MMTCFAGYEHRKATRSAVIRDLGGHGPDWEKLQESLKWEIH